MKIAIVDWLFPRPLAVFSYAKARSFERLGHEVHMITTRAPGGRELAGVADSGLLDKTRYIPKSGRTRWPLDIVNGLAHHPSQTAACLSNSWRLRSSDSRAELGQALRGIASLRTLKDERFDIVHVEWGPLGRRLFYVGELSRAPMVVAFKGMGLYPVRGGNKKIPETDEFIARSYRPLISRARAFTAVTPYVRDRMIELGFPAARTHVMQEGADTRRFEWVARRWHDDGTWRFVTTGRLTAIKGVDVALRALATLKDDIEYEFTVIGDGPDEAMLTQLAADLGISNRVRFLGHLSWDAIAQEYASMDAFLFPGRRLTSGQEEAGGMTPREAAATGLPVISSRVGGATDNVVHGVTGFLVPPASVEELARAIRDLTTYDDPKLDAMSRAARGHIQDKLSRDHWDEQLLHLYESLG